MNKKGQQYQQERPQGGAPFPVVLGVILIAGPMIARIWNFNIPFTGFFKVLGIILILVGVIMYALKK